MFRYNFLSVALIALGIVTVQGQLKETDDCNLKLIDECGYKIFRSVAEKSAFPSNQEETLSTCEEMKAGLDCFTSLLEKCPNFIPEKMSNDFVETVKSNIESICEAGSSLQKKIIKNGACIHQALDSDSSQCMATFLKGVEAARESTPRDQRMSHICCAMVTYDKCFYESLGKKCNSESARTGRRIVQGFAIYMAERCLGFLAEPKRCTTLPAVQPAKQIPFKSIVPSITIVLGDLDKDQ